MLGMNPKQYEHIKLSKKVKEKGAVSEASLNFTVTKIRCVTFSAIIALTDHTLFIM